MRAKMLLWIFENIYLHTSSLSVTCTMTARPNHCLTPPGLR